MTSVGEAVYIPGIGGVPDEPPPLVVQNLTQAGWRVHTAEYSYMDPALDLSDLVEEIAAGVDTAGVSDSALLFGHSLGGLMCAAEAARRDYGALAVFSATAVGTENAALLREDEAWPAITASLQEMFGRGSDDVRWFKSSLSEPGDALTERFAQARIPDGRRRVLLGGLERLAVMKAQAFRVAALLRTGLTIVPAATHDLDGVAYTRAATEAVHAINPGNVSR
jgi:pimeloyl-ACP methyl ester carboxylesterase